MLGGLRNDSDNIFYSKVDALLIIIIALAAIITIATCGIICKESIDGSSSEPMVFASLFLSFEIAIFLLIADAFIRCRYIFKEDYLYIQSGIFVRVKIHYKNIKSFCESNNALSAPACSLDRIKIVYKNKNSGKESFTLVSPRNKQRFMEKLGAILDGNR